MGLIRKTMSMGTLGAVDFRSDKERTAAYTKAAKKEAKKQTKLQREQAARHRAEPATLAPPSTVAPGWYPEPSGQPCQRWWDGTTWTEQTQPTPPS